MLGLEGKSSILGHCSHVYYKAFQEILGSSQVRIKSNKKKSFAKITIKRKTITAIIRHIISMGEAPYLSDTDNKLIN